MLKPSNILSLPLHLFRVSKDRFLSGPTKLSGNLDAQNAEKS
jgi:hypothetical protein